MWQAAEQPSKKFERADPATRAEDAGARDLLDRRNDFSPATQPSTTRSMSTAT
jgi:hypothetical protein